MLSAIGDAVQVLPVASALRRAFPHLHLSWVLQRVPLSLVQGHPAVDEFIPFHRGDRSRPWRSVVGGWRGIRSAVQRLREIAARQPGGRFDLLLDLQVYLKAGLITAFTPARVKLGFDSGRTRDLNRLFTTHRIPPHPQGAGHIQEQYFEFLDFIGVDPEPVEFGLDLSEAERESQQVFRSDIGRPYCAMVVASSDVRKNWTPEGYARVAAEVGNSFGLRPILVGGHSDLEEGMARAILNRSGSIVVDARGGGLRRLLWLLDGAALVISPDTGPLHMARAMETPVVGLFGFTNPKRSGPYQRFSELVVDGYARYPGEVYSVSRERRSGGMGRITPAMVLERVERALTRSEPESLGGTEG
jgi:heptosyltransferase I